MVSMHYITAYYLENSNLPFMLPLALHLHANAPSANVLVSFLLQTLSSRTKSLESAISGDYVYTIGRIVE